MAGIVILVLVLISVFLDVRSLSDDHEYLNLRRQLLNKATIKSIQTEYGDILDCVDIYKQPALHHPKLTNHTIQMRPTSYPEGMETQGPSNASLEIGLKDGGCPLGSVPIRRTKMQDLLRVKSPPYFGRKNAEYYTHHVYGTRVNMNVWDPVLADQRQFSLAQFWIVNGPLDQLNTIEAGWTANPWVFGDSFPRLFVYWTADGYKKTGCYNLLCPGFVQVSRNIPIGAIIQPLSTYNGNQWEIILQVFKDRKTGDRWLTFGDKNHPVGYWPKSLFTSLADSASTVAWGGEVHTPAGTKSPQMGSGHFPSEGFKKACYLRFLRFVDNTNKLIDIPKRVLLYADVPQCYKVVDGGSGRWGRHIFFGGPGGQC